MSADVVPVLVIGPNDLVTTSLGAALAARGFAVDRHPGDAALPAAPPVGGVALVNLDVPDGTERISHAARAGWYVLVVGRPSDPERTAAAVAAGADAQVSRRAPLDALVAKVTELIAGQPGMSEDERTTWMNMHRAVLQEVDSGRRRLDLLTDREFEVLRRLERGQRAAEISAEVMVAMSTVRSHIRSILTKLEVNSQQQAVELYRETRRHAEHSARATTRRSSVGDQRVM
jgi:DNA-binding NarL/FixJ family response regulator